MRKIGILLLVIAIVLFCLGGVFMFLSGVIAGAFLMLHVGYYIDKRMNP